MEILQKYEQPIRKLKGIYIFVFISYLITARMVPFVNFISQDVNSVIFSALAIIGAAILAAEFFMTYSVFKSRENLILLAFWVICLISSLLNMKYGIVNNIKTLVWMAIQFYLLFSFVNIKDEGEINTTLKRIMNSSAAIWLVGVLVSLVQFILQISYIEDFVDFPRRQGFMESRLFGIFTDPNFAALTSMIIIVFCWYLLKDCKNKKLRIYYYINIAFQLIYIVLSGSRTALLEGFVLVFVIAALEERNKVHDKVWLKSLLKGVIAVAISVALVFAIQKTMLWIAEVCEPLRASISIDNGEENNEDDKITLNRPDVNEDNISNNRFDIWKSAIEVSQGKRLFGVSPRNLTPYAIENYPDSYLVREEYETHNGYLAVFVNSGIMGTIAVLALLVDVLYLLCVYIKRKKNQAYESVIIMLLAVLFIIASSATLQPELFFVNSYGAAVFWLFLGYFVYLLKSKTPSEN